MNFHVKDTSNELLVQSFYLQKLQLSLSNIQSVLICIYMGGGGEFLNEMQNMSTIVLRQVILLNHTCARLCHAI